MIFMLNVILRASSRIFERVVGLQNLIEAETVGGLGIVGMVSLSEMTEYPLNRLRVGVRAELQDFVIVGECRRIHNLPPKTSLPTPSRCFLRSARKLSRMRSYAINSYRPTE